MPSPQQLGLIRFFVVKHKEKIKFDVVKENPLPDNRHEHILKDEIILFTGIKSKKKFSKKLRRAALWDDENKQVIEVITNQKTWTANTISELHKSRLQVEIFFSNIIQLLHIKSFAELSPDVFREPDYRGLLPLSFFLPNANDPRYFTYGRNLNSFSSQSHRKMPKPLTSIPTNPRSNGLFD